MALISQEQKKRNEMAQVVEEAVICGVHTAQMEDMLKQNPVFNLQITKLIGLRLKKVQSRLDAMFFQNAEQRVKSFIKELADEHGKKLLNNEVEVKLNLTHEDIAKLTATTRQKVTTVLSDLEKQGIISYDRKRILVHRISAI
jgi:CRP/FNR family transcriptional regulator